MEKPVIRKTVGFVILLFSILFCHVQAQTYKFKKYGIEEGICHPFVYTVVQDANGYLWVATGEGLCRFNGFGFSLLQYKDSAKVSFPTSDYKDENENIWFGHNDGNISFHDGKEFKIIYTDSTINSTIKAITKKDKGEIVFATQTNGLIVADYEFNLRYINRGLKNIFISSIGFVGNGNYLLGTTDGLFLYNLPEGSDSIAMVKEIAEIQYTTVQSLKKGEGNYYYAGTEDAGFYMIRYSDAGKIDVIDIGAEYGLESENVQDVFEDTEMNIWVATYGSGVFRFSKSMKKGKAYDLLNYTEKNGLDSKFAKKVYQDREGNIWIGSYGNGLARLVDESFVFVNYEENIEGNHILSIDATENYYWIGASGGLLRDEIGGDDIKYYDQKNGLPNDDIISVLVDKEGNVWTGTSRNGLFKKSSDSEQFTEFMKSQNSLENKINSMVISGNILWIGTSGGAIKYNLETRERKRYTTTEGLPHNDIKMLYKDSKGTIWVATRTNSLFSLNRDKLYNISGNRMELEFTCIVEDTENNIWAGTYGNGIFKFTEDSLFYFSEKQGLKSNYVYSLALDNNGNIWSGHRLGLSRIETKNNTIKTYGAEIGILGDCLANSVVKDNNGLLLFGTTDGIVRYNYKKDKVIPVAPALNITNIELNDRRIDPGQGLNLGYGIYKLKVDFIGIHLNSPESVKYRFKMEGYDLSWSDYSNFSTAVYSRLEDGEYTFLLEACTGDNVCSQQPLEFAIKIKPPFWKSWWFITLSIISVVLIVYAIIKYRERKQKKLQEYLEHQLDLRTTEVVKQKDEIELKNRDITDSINYAQRIQASILPSHKLLQNTFSGAFVFYEPRDIVSGDWYWYDMVSEDKILIVCADSTGHGVPGAFMSIIGSTLVKDISMKQNITRPSKVLLSLNNELVNTLNQNADLEKSTDGMDMIVCEIDTKTNFVKISSAMRPYILIQNGEINYYKGNQVAVGGAFKEEKKFIDDEIQLKKGDIIYMFSDGYNDQFGGPMGKKFKTLRLNKLIEEIKGETMDEQYRQISETFFNWKEGMEQVDDVLFMGIQI